MRQIASRTSGAYLAYGWLVEQLSFGSQGFCAPLDSQSSSVWMAPGRPGFESSDHHLVLQEINTLYSDVMDDMSEFKVLANDAWKEMIEQTNPSLAS